MSSAFDRCRKSKGLQNKNNSEHNLQVQSSICACCENNTYHYASAAQKIKKISMQSELLNYCNFYEISCLKCKSSNLIFTKY